MPTIVVGYVPKAEGRAALRHAMDEAKLRSAAIVVVSSTHGAGDFDTDDVVAAELETVRDDLARAGVEAEVRQLAHGSDVVDDLVAAARETSAAIIVIGLRRRSPTGKLVLGSNAQRILLDAPCPVLAVTAAETD